MTEKSDHQTSPPSSNDAGPEPPSFSTRIKPQERKPHDPDVLFQEYHYYALTTREKEKDLVAPSTNWWNLLFGKRNVEEDSPPSYSEDKLASQSGRAQISDEEWTNASRAFRTAGMGACFYLITTDILGPYSVGFALGTLGWGPGIALYTVFGFMAGYSGYLLWHVFCGVDSYEFPAKNYGDLAFRTYGSGVRHFTNLLQALGLLLLLGQVTIQYGENISAVSKFRLCYAVCPVLFVIFGFLFTQIRTLKAYGWVATLSVWLNLMTIFITMGVMAHSPPRYEISKLGSAGSAVNSTTITPDKNGNYPAIIHYSALPTNGLVGSINGLLSGVLAYAGAQLFVEFMAEMKRPRDFLKAMWGAQFFIYTVYLIYGCFVYNFQGQYSFSPSYQGVSSYAWQTVGNMITLIGALIAAGLYGNIGIKVFYNNVLIDIFNTPPLITRTGKIIYACIVPIWWIVAFVIAASIPDYFGFVSVISACVLLPLTYVLPPLFALGYDIQRHAISAENSDRGESTIQRWTRGFVSGGPFQVCINVWHIIYILASMSMAGLGMYAAVEGLIEAFKRDQLSAFSCKSPLNL